MDIAHKVKVIDEFQVSPPPGSLPNTISLPLTFFDLPWLLIRNTHRMQRLFFYTYPDISLQNFTQTLIPSLKSSLSLTLQHFFPFVSNLILPPQQPEKPYILFTQGNSITFLVAEYPGDFNHVKSDQAKDVRILHPFAPRLLSTRLSPDGTRVDPLLAVQVTLFPNQGVCIGIEFHHVVADGKAVHHFMKSWALICRSNDYLYSQEFLMPSFDRSSIEDPYELESRSLQQWRDWHSSCEVFEIPTNDDIYTDKVRSTFVLKRSQIERLKQYFSNKSTIGMAHFSSFVVTCSFSWVCLIKSLKSSDNGGDKLCCHCFVADCRNRFGISLPTNYFGNCLAALFPMVERNELVAHDGLIVAARSIVNCIKELESNGALREIEKWVTITDGQSLGSSIFTTVAGSPKMGVYQTDFGWGCPVKTEVTHIDLSSTISLGDCRNGEGGIEIQLALKREEMDAFTEHFEEGLKLL
ncbi:coumaroyl-CoA:anthocyanidin 3-O-glucoside-6''-O-coumaroyltransferase 1-like [Rutidosis leptorrhynchoides]|uniref:coumaroyl-CoA:anthocyanidin 3-O-glucoside-6''-O-coumaroyltransferase 1-like n=1 Tax=Rutidosis leptorrhynchoides TaxID=125765 RepID=UPI003A994359